MDAVMAGSANHEGFTSLAGHDGSPCRTWFDAGEVGETPDLVDLDIVRGPA
jgi:hypothetical protein